MIVRLRSTCIRVCACFIESRQKTGRLLPSSVWIGNTSLKGQLLVSAKQATPTRNPIKESKPATQSRNPHQETKPGTQSRNLLSAHFLFVLLHMPLAHDFRLTALSFAASLAESCCPFRETSTLWLPASSGSPYRGVVASSARRSDVRLAGKAKSAPLFNTPSKYIMG